MPASSYRIAWSSPFRLCIKGKYYRQKCEIRYVALESSYCRGVQYVVSEEGGTDGSSIRRIGVIVSQGVARLDSVSKAYTTGGNVMIRRIYLFNFATTYQVLIGRKDYRRKSVTSFRSYRRQSDSATWKPILPTEVCSAISQGSHRADINSSSEEKDSVCKQTAMTLRVLIRASWVNA